MNDFALDLVRYAGGSAVVLAVFAWLFKTALMEALRREADRLRSGIERDSALALERVRQEWQSHLESARHELSKELEGYKVRFARLQEKRLEPLLRLFTKVAKASSQATVLRATRDLDDSEMTSSWTERLQRLRESCNDALNDYHAARFFLPQQLAQRVNTAIVSMKHCILEHDAQLRSSSPEKARDRFFDSKYQQDYPAVVEELASEFRGLLGVERWLDGWLSRE